MELKVGTVSPPGILGTTEWRMAKSALFSMMLCTACMRGEYRGAMGFVEQHIESSK